MSKTSQPHCSQREFEDGLISMMIEDMESMRMVERPGFKAFSAKFLARYKMPSRRTANRHLEGIYEEEKNKLLEKLDKVLWLSFTADT